MALRRRRQMEAAEPARVVIAQEAAANEPHIDVIVGSRRARIGQITQAARHTEMHEQRAHAGAEQQVLPAPLDAVDALPRKRRGQVAGHRPT